GGCRAACTPEIDLEDKGVAHGPLLQHIAEWRVRYQTPIPIIFAVYLDGRKRRGQGARSHKVLRPQSGLAVIKVDEITVAHVYCTDGNMQVGAVDAVEIAQALQSVFQGINAIKAGFGGRIMH